MSEMDFFGDESDVVLPKIGAVEEGIVTIDIEDAIASSEVASVLLPTDDEVILPNFVVDMRSIEEIDPIQIEVLDSFVVGVGGDVAIYILISGGLQKIGMGDSTKVGRIIAKAVESTFGNDCVVYKDFEVDKKPIVYKSKDITKLRLNI